MPLGLNLFLGCFCILTAWFLATGFMDSYSRPIAPPPTQTKVIRRIPEHASLDTLGKWWRCDKGYYKKGDVCLLLNLPEHAQLDGTGNDWECEYGFKRQDLGCVEMPLKEREQQKRELLLMHLKELEQEGGRGSSGGGSRITVKTPACLAGYNACTSRCSAAVYDVSMGGARRSDKYQAACFAACSSGMARCQREGPRSQCDVFEPACSPRCPGVIVADGAAGDICQNACLAGKSRCAYQAERLRLGVD
jgi:hypothetical protein